jgi:hypothetical protein
MRAAKTHITAIVKNYIKLYPQEFELFKKGMTAVRASLKDEEFGTTDSKYQRALYECPRRSIPCLLWS